MTHLNAMPGKSPMPELEQEIKNLEQTLLRPQVRGDGSALDALLHDDFEELGSSGAVITKAEAIEWLLREEDRFEWSLSAFRIKSLAPDLVQALYRCHKRDRDTAEVKLSNRSSLWKKTGDQWAMLFHQGTNLKDPGISR